MEAKGSDTNLLILDNNKKAPFGFAKTKFKYNNEYIKGYELYNSDGNFYLVNAKNLETGEQDFYLYDKENHTFQNLYKYPFNLIMYLSYMVITLFGIIALYIIVKILKALFISKKRR